MNAAPQSTKPKTKKTSSSSTLRLSWGAAVAIVLILAIAAAGTLGRWGQQEEELLQPITFTYRDRTLTPAEGVAVNEYAKEVFAFSENGRAAYASAAGSAKVGIDVSFHQGEIDWQQVAADGVDFAMIRLGYRGYTQGGLIEDTYFRQNIQGALEAGLEVGVYFFSQSISPEEAAEEADYVHQLLEGYDLSYPVAYDWEFITSGSETPRTAQMDGETLTACVRAFCGRIRELGYDTAVYFNQDLAYLTLDLSQLADIPFWLAEYGGAPDFYYDFDLWQYTCTGSVAGITGNVDIDLDLRPAKA